LANNAAQQTAQAGREKLWRFAAFNNFFYYSTALAVNPPAA